MTGQRSVSLHDEVATYYEAVLAEPDEPALRAALGCALARAGRVADALPHLRRAVADEPLDVQAARALWHALGDLGDREGQRALARERQRLQRELPDLVPAEQWFTQVPPGRDELASIIILCCNEAESTRQCLESVRRCTSGPYELVLVDNGSTDGTAALLAEEQAGRVTYGKAPERVVVVRNATNRGFPAGCNQGIAEARGRFVVFLNNDTVVTPGWLDGLSAWAVHEWPSVGLVGAMSNYAPPPQLVEVERRANSSYDLLAVAEQRQREFVGQAVAVERLSGFCLLARREVLDQVGGFDERFGLGFFDDDDLCVRVRQVGYRLLVALNVFVHHQGSRTFAGLGVDCRQQLAENLTRFREKWGPERAAGYRLPDTVAAGRARVSLCMIVRNEEHNLPACLETVADLVDELVIVDTGSTDRTPEVAARFGARVLDFPWVDSFAAARTESLRHATGDFVLWMDADDRLDEVNRQRLRDLLATLNDEPSAHVMKCLCLPDEDGGGATLVDHVRLFRRQDGLAWRYRVHEQILPSLRERGYRVAWSDVVIHHTGYTEGAVRARKLERDLRLLRLDLAEQPDDPFVLFNLGSVYQELGRPAEALAFLEASLQRSAPGDSITRKLFALISGCQRRLEQPQRALAACRAGRQHFPDDVELLFQEGAIRHELGDAAGAEACWQRVLEVPAEEHFASVDTGLRGWRTRHVLALLYQQQGRLAEAASLWQAVLAERPDFGPARQGLDELAGCSVACAAH